MSVNRSGVYYQPQPPSPAEVQLKHRIDAIYTTWPFYGSRKITAQLQLEGVEVNRKAIQRHIREMGIAGICPGPNLSKRTQKEGIFPYLLRHTTSHYPNHIWGLDITYIRLRGGWMYLVALLDWYSRYVVSWLRHEVASVAVEADKTELNLVFHHQYLTETCVGSNSGVGSSRNNVPSLMRGRWNREGKS
ncbi:MAG: IS3 family transposase [Ktedonobacteraceae bacterium]